MRRGLGGKRSGLLGTSQTQKAEGSATFPQRQTPLTAFSHSTQHTLRHRGDAMTTNASNAKKRQRYTRAAPPTPPPKPVTSRAGINHDPCLTCKRHKVKCTWHRGADWHGRVLLRPGDGQGSNATLTMPYTNPAAQLQARGASHAAGGGGFGIFLIVGAGRTAAKWEEKKTGHGPANELTRLHAPSTHTTGASPTALPAIHTPSRPRFKGRAQRRLWLRWTAPPSQLRAASPSAIAFPSPTPC